MKGDLLIPCEGGRSNVGWLRVPPTLPREVDRGREGIYVLEERGTDRHPVYVCVD